MPKKTTKKTVVKKKKEPKYELTIKVNDVEFNTKADSVLEAVSNFVDSKDFPYGAKTQSVFTLESGKQKGVMTVPAIRTRRLFMQFPEKDSALEVFCHTLERRLG